MEENKSSVFAMNEEEIEKSHFGGEFYRDAYRLPKIILTSENIETFKNYTTLVRDISESCGEEVTFLFAELYKMYSMDHETNNGKNKPIIDFCTQSIGKLALSLKQSERLLLLMNEFENKKEEKTIDGIDYCFILIVISELFNIYSIIYNYMLRKRYYPKEALENILQRLSLLISEEFQSIRILFKGVECYNEIDSSPTFH